MMLSIQTKRSIVTARSTLAQNVAESLLPAERSADASAISAFKCVTAMLELRDTAGLPVTAGSEVLELLHAASTQAFAAQASLRAAHDKFVVLADDFGITDYAPYCPPNKQSLQAVKAAA
ncbi:hypothetical protein [Sphingomonas sp. HMP6]|uniref:hypothetical protein n=1 Tax=Sphingomonas sp. HMP6 TaxID=1517551 RepID=UPI001596592F|nr:hypothetical protein [Sphingomonas sp. HMP6]BCA59125.1 hypothetical protein HMP06_1894 [Sphingomonas sp. HMP6]